MIRDQHQRALAQEALAVLHRLREAYVDAIIQYAPTSVFLESQEFRREANDALFTFADMVYGKPAPEESNCLCDKCHMARALDGLFFDSRHVPLFLCPACSQQQALAQVGNETPETPSPGEAAPQEERV